MLAGVTGMQKVAAFLIGVGPEASTLIMKQLRPDDVERITLEIFRMRHVPAKLTEAVMEEIYNALIAADYMSSGGLEFAQELLTRTLGPQRAAELIARLSARIKAGPFDFLREVDAVQLVSFIQHEHPQTIALVLCYLEPDQAARVLTSLGTEVQADVAMRIAQMEGTGVAPDVVKDLERLLKKKVSAVSSQGFASVGGVKHVVKMLVEADQTAQKDIMDLLDESSPELADEIKKNMFVFEDINRLQPRDIVRINREIDMKDLAVALKGASDELRKRFMEAMSKRAAADLQEQIDIMPPTRLATVEEAQQKVLAVIRRLEQADEITISRGGKDEYV
ncbi:MAG: flagellar motor switch protein FliG [Chloroflexi bacterium]|nr:flagellar motor switch protein FliG [Chloroflexota bacterium]